MKQLEKLAQQQATVRLLVDLRAPRAATAPLALLILSHPTLQSQVPTRALTGRASTVGVPSSVVQSPAYTEVSRRSPPWLHGLRWAGGGGPLA